VTTLHGYGRTSFTANDDGTWEVYHPRDPREPDEKFYGYVTKHYDRGTLMFNLVSDMGEDLISRRTLSEIATWLES
jgi:hypothetical protein